MSAFDIAVVLAAYLVGSVPFAWLMTRAALGIDLRQAGSGNVGAANVQRTAGMRKGLLVAALDVCKGAASVWLAVAAGAVPSVVSAAGVAAVVGHVFPVWLGFRGGKGVAASCGVFAVLAPLATLVAVMTFLVTVFVTRFVSLGSMIATLVLVSVTFWRPGVADVSMAGSAVASLIMVKHRENLLRLLRGRERRIGLRTASPATLDRGDTP